MEPWQTTRIEAGRFYRARVGPLSIWLRRSDDEVQIATELDSTEAEPTACEALVETGAPKDVEPEWERWVVGDSASGVRLTPVLPDRAVVARPESPLTLPTGQEALFLVSVPVWVRVSIEDGPDLREYPTVVLSNIWFGDPMAGELCYSLRTRARRRIEDAPPRCHRAVCPVRIRNDAPKPLEIERFSLGVKQLRVYAGRRLWTGEVRVHFRGEEHASEVRYPPEPPSLEPVGEVISEAREPAAPRGLVRKTLGGLKQFAHIQ